MEKEINIENELSLKNLKSELLKILHENGIPEFKITLKEYKNNPKKFLGCYRSLSQFRSNPIICIDINQHKETLKEMGEYNEYSFKSAIMDTLCHEYVHVIEEWIRFEAIEKNGKNILEKLNKFEDMEDFAETIGKWMNGTNYLFNEQLKDVKEIMNFFIENVFEEDSINWVKQPKWKRLLDFHLDTNENHYSKLNSMEGSFNKCKRVSEHLANKLYLLDNDLNIKIIRLSGYNKSLNNAHKKWKNIDPFYMIHYAVLLEDNFVIDLTSKQFDNNNSLRAVKNLEDYKKDWLEMDIFKNLNKTSSKINKII